MFHHLTISRHPKIGALFLSAIGLLMFAAGCKETTTVNSPPDNLLDPNVKPVVLYTYPPNNGVGPFNVYTRGVNGQQPHFFLQFNKLMITSSFTSQDRKSVV